MGLLMHGLDLDGFGFSEVSVTWFCDLRVDGLAG